MLRLPMDVLRSFADRPYGASPNPRERTNHPRSSHAQRLERLDARHAATPLSPLIDCVNCLIRECRRAVGPECCITCLCRHRCLRRMNAGASLESTIASRVRIECGKDIIQPPCFVDVTSLWRLLHPATVPGATQQAVVSIRDTS